MTAKRKKPDNTEDAFERTVVTSIEKVACPKDERAYILFIAGPLIGKMYLLERAETTIGRADDADITIRDPRISREHVCINVTPGRISIIDLDSTNGTFVNGERVTKVILENGDKIHLSSDTLFKFAVGDEAEGLFYKEMEQMANYDAVTGIANKHVFSRRMKEEFSFAKRTKWPLSFLMIDIDFFKKVNDTYGHMAGDYVLTGVAQRIQEAVRDEDILARLGGEEFGVILRGIDKPGAVTLAERICQSIEAKPFRFENQKISVTISIGVATLAGDNFAKAKELLAHADECLYVSKENGRNRVTA